MTTDINIPFTTDQFIHTIGLSVNYIVEIFLWYVLFLGIFAIITDGSSVEKMGIIVFMFIALRVFVVYIMFMGTRDEEKHIFRYNYHLYFIWSLIKLFPYRLNMKE